MICNHCKEKDFDSVKYLSGMYFEYCSICKLHNPLYETDKYDTKHNWSIKMIYLSIDRLFGLSGMPFYTKDFLSTYIETFKLHKKVVNMPDDVAINICNQFAKNYNDKFFLHRITYSLIYESTLQNHE